MRLGKGDFIMLCTMIALLLFLTVFNTFQYRTACIESNEKTAIIGAYAEVLHRIWIDRPVYVEDVLCETDEFIRLDSLVKGDFEDTFIIWNQNEDATYKQNLTSETGL